MLTSYTLRRLAEEARDRADDSVVRAPDPSPAVAPDPAPARVPTVDELLAELEAENKRRADIEAAFDAAIETVDAEVSKRIDAATNELASKLADARAIAAELEAKHAAAAETHATDLGTARAANDEMSKALARAIEANAALEGQLAAARARIVELETSAAAAPIADAPPALDASPADDTTPPRRRR